jgi:hypothetical protein
MNDLYWLTDEQMTDGLSLTRDGRRDRRRGCELQEAAL